jgi:hypothetical protein
MDSKILPRWDSSLNNNKAVQINVVALTTAAATLNQNNQLDREQKNDTH